jgi:hypothetical protein
MLADESVRLIGLPFACQAPALFDHFRHQNVSIKFWMA